MTKKTSAHTDTKEQSQSNFKCGSMSTAGKNISCTAANGLDRISVALRRLFIFVSVQLFDSRSRRRERGTRGCRCYLTRSSQASGTIYDAEGMKPPCPLFFPTLPRRAPETQADSIFQRDLPEEKIRKHRRYWHAGFHLHDREGRPVMYDRVGAADHDRLRREPDALNVDDLVEIFCLNMEVRASRSP